MGAVVKSVLALAGRPWVSVVVYPGGVLDRPHPVECSDQPEPPPLVEDTDQT